MIRAVITFVIIGAVAFAAWMIADFPGSVVVDWRGYHVTTSVAVVAAVMAVFAVVVAILYRFWWNFIGLPGTMSRSNRNRRQRQGIKALGRGLAAIAAGDADEAQQQAARASDLLDDRPLTLLLQAQAAQLKGDERAAEKYFKALSEWPGTEFLGTRGLLTQALKREEWVDALDLARRAYRMNPKSEWVVTTLYQLQKRMHRWGDAEATLKTVRKLRLLESTEIDREHADLLYQRSVEAQGAEAIALARKALNENPQFLEAAVRRAELLLGQGQDREAAKRIEEAWERLPRPELLELYYRARGVGDDAAKRLESARRLVGRSPASEQSRLAVGTAALAAEQWDEARRNLEPMAAGPDVPPAVCRLMAQLEERQHGDMARSREWLMRASGAEVSPPPRQDTGKTEPPIVEATAS